MSMEMRYEKLVGYAFGFAKGGKMLDRGEDPARLADADVFQAHRIAEAKTGAAYSMAILTSALLNHPTKEYSDDERERLSSFTGQAIAASDIAALGELIADFDKTVTKEYFNCGDGPIRFK